MSVDYSVFDTPTAPSDLEKVRALAEELRDLETQDGELDETIKMLKSRVKEIKERELPEMLGDLGMGSFSLSDGFSVEISDIVNGSLPKEPEERKRAIGLLVEYGAEGLIKNDINLSFGRNEDNEAKALAADLRDKGYEAEIVENVHHSTLAAFVRERLKKGEEVDAQALGVYVGRVAKSSFGGK